MRLISKLLIVDDDEDILEEYSELLSELLDAEVVPSDNVLIASELANESLFDVIILDARIRSEFTEFGGIDLFNKLRPKYGKNSMLLYSQYINENMIHSINKELQFIEKKIEAAKFVKKLISNIKSLRIKQKCFVAMPFDPSFDKLYEVIDTCVKSLNFKPIRIDRENNHIVTIDQKIFTEIYDCKFMIFVTLEHNPNVFLEAGYALANKKTIITITNNVKTLPFDIRNRQAITFDNLEDLQIKLMKTISVL